MKMDSPEYKRLLPRQTLLAVLSPEEKRAQLNDMKPEHSLIKRTQPNKRAARCAFPTTPSFVSLLSVCLSVDLLYCPNRAMSTESFVIPKTQAGHRAQYVAAEYNPQICLL